MAWEVRVYLEGEDKPIKYEESEARGSARTHASGIFEKSYFNDKESAEVGPIYYYPTRLIRKVEVIEVA